MSAIISFGQRHIHKVNGKVLDRNVVARVRDRAHAFELFGDQWAFEYKENELSEENFPRGIIDFTTGE